jgi:hypothetical protein
VDGRPLASRELSRTETLLRRVVVVGGLGLFGRTIAEQLLQVGVEVRVASRRGAADLQVDANDRESIQSAIRAGDVVIDAAGPFHVRSTVLIEAAIQIGFDLIDINDNLQYAERIAALEPQIAAAGIRVLSSASSVSAVAAAVVAHSGVPEPKRVRAFLAPATRYTANAGTALSLIQTVGQPVRLWRDGRFQTDIGWRESRRFPMATPIGTVCGRLFESADSLYLPQIWPSLRDVVMYVDTRTPGLNWLLWLAAHSRAMRNGFRRGVGIGTAIARRLGPTAGGLGYDIEDAAGRIRRCAITAKKHSYLTAVAPAVLAARAIREDRFTERGLVLPDRQVESSELFAFLRAAGISVSFSG